MKIYNQPIELLVNVPPPSKFKKVNILSTLQDAGIPLQKPVLQKQNKGFEKSLTNTNATQQKIATTITDAEMNPWDVAHKSANALGSSATFIEPDLPQEFVIDRNLDAPFKKGKSSNSKKDDIGFDPDWMPHQNTIWHLLPQYSGLQKAREAVENLSDAICIGHLDTGYSAHHPVIKDAIKNNSLQRNFVDGEHFKDASDPYTDGLLRMPGHGTGTLALLAGDKIKESTGDGVFNDYLGGAPFADVICCRIARSVILMKTSAFADALNYLTQLCHNGKPVHIATMSMGGAPSKAWADAVNKAYDAGITVIAAAGNCYNGLPTRKLVFPARFQRVIAACGATYEYKPYQIFKIDEMQGCFGPVRYMNQAMAAFTPNVPWAVYKNGKAYIKYSGAGTSSAAPQIAAAAAIYYRKYYNELNSLKPWQRVEAIRHALYKKALKKSSGVTKDFKKYFGQGILQAYDALSVPVKDDLPQTPEDRVSFFPILNTLFKALPNKGSKRLEMYNTELAQLVYHYPDLAELIDDEEKPFEKVSKPKWKAFTNAVIAHPGASVSLKQYLMQQHTAQF